jgi:hypothetical protein
MIYVGCKLPVGVTLELFEDVPAMQGAPGGISPLMFHPPRTKAKVTLRGANSVRNDFTLRGLSQEVYPFAVTQVPADFWGEWIARNRDLAFVRNGFVFALDRERDVVTEAKQREKERIGLEPLNPEIERDPRANQDTAIRAQGVKTDLEHLRKLQNMNGRG